MKNERTVVTTELSYEQMDAEMQGRVDAKLALLREADSNELLTFGIESQTQVTQYASDMLTKISSTDKVENIEGIMEEVLDVTKPFIESTEKKNFLQRIFTPRTIKPKFDRSMFAQKINTLIDAIELQIGRLMADNIMYDDYISLLVNNVGSINETIVALRQYIDEVESEAVYEVSDNSDDVAIMLKRTENTHLLDQLRRRLNMFMISRQESMQVAVSARVIQNNNVVLSDRLQTLLVVGIPILQNQIVLKASMLDTKTGLDICDSVASSIDNAMKQNATQLKELTDRISGTDGMAVNAQSVVDMSKDIISIAEELRSLNGKARSDLKNMEAQIEQSDASLAELFKMLSVSKGDNE